MISQQCARRWEARRALPSSKKQRAPPGPREACGLSGEVTKAHTPKCASRRFGIAAESIHLAGGQHIAVEGRAGLFIYGHLEARPMLCDAQSEAQPRNEPVEVPEDGPGQCEPGAVVVVDVVMLEWDTRRRGRRFGSAAVPPSCFPLGGACSAVPAMLPFAHTITLTARL